MPKYKCPVCCCDRYHFFNKDNNGVTYECDNCDTTFRNHVKKKLKRKEAYRKWYRTIHNFYPEETDENRERYCDIDIKEAFYAGWKARGKK